MIPRAHAGFIAVICLLLVLLLLSLALPCEGQERTPASFKITAGALAGLAAVDVAQSAPCLRAGARCREVGPFYRGVSPAGMVTIKAAGIGGSIAVAWKLRRRHPRVAWLMLGGLTGVQAVVVAHNARELRKR